MSTTTIACDCAEEQNVVLVVGGECWPRVRAGTAADADDRQTLFCGACGTMNESAEHGTMVRNSADTWPDDAPPGVFDIEQHGLEGYPGVTGHIMFECPNRHRCSVLLAPQPIPRRDPRQLYVWGWDGNVERPTIIPSINCIAEKDGKPTGGCGWHGFITKGVMK